MSILTVISGVLAIGMVIPITCLSSRYVKVKAYLLAIQGVSVVVYIYLLYRIW